MYHIPVLLKESIDFLIDDIDGIYVDVTFGGGGHTKEILSRLSSKGRLIAFDQDEDARGNIAADDRMSFVPSNFRYLKEWLDYLEIEKVDGVLADLGVSSFQFDEIGRGFSYRGDAFLDMRMNKDSPLTAREVLKNYNAKQLQEMFSKYGEIRNAKQLSTEIVERRRAKVIDTVTDFLGIVERVIKGKRMQYLSQVFQAIRIEVNDEMNALSEMLNDATEVIKPAGSLVVISYHSGEDKPVKMFMKSGNIQGKIEKDEMGRNLKPFKELKNCPIIPSEEEIVRNVRARSAKMRVGRRL